MMSNQTVFVALILLFSSVHARVKIPDELVDYVKDLHDGCIAKIGLSEDVHKDYEIGNKDPKVKCYMDCMMLDGKWMSPDKTIQYDFIEKSAHPDIKDILMKAINQCRDIPAGTDPCDKAYNFNECMYKADPENWYLF